VAKSLLKFWSDIMTTATKKIKVTLIKSVIGTKEDHRATVKGLGLRRVNSTSVLEDTPAIRGMVRKIAYLLKCEG
jgi:large subunit ribosomal protein L30